MSFERHISLAVKGSTKKQFKHSEPYCHIRLMYVFELALEYNKIKISGVSQKYPAKYISFWINNATCHHLQRLMVMTHKSNQILQTSVYFAIIDFPLPPSPIENYKRVNIPSTFQCTLMPQLGIIRLRQYFNNICIVLNKIVISHNNKTIFILLLQFF